MKKTLKDKISDKLVNAFLKNKIISAIPKKFTKKLNLLQQIASRNRSPGFNIEGEPLSQSFNHLPAELCLIFLSF